MPTCFWILVVSSPTCLWWKRGPGGHFLGQVPQRSGQLSIGKLTCQTIHGEHQSPAQWPHTRIFPGKTKLVLQPRSSVQTYNQEPNNIQQTYTEPTFSRSPKPTNDKRLTNQNIGRCCHRARKSCPLAAPKSRAKNAVNWGGHPWRDRFC